MGQKLTTKDILNMDCRKEKGYRTIQRALFKIPQIQKAYDKLCKEEQEEWDFRIPQEILERMLHQLSIRKKYIVMNIQPFYGKNHDEFVFYTSSVKRITDHVWVGSVYGVTLYEVVCKLVIMIYSDTKNPKKQSISKDADVSGV